MIRDFTGVGSDYFVALGDTLPVGAFFPSPAVPGQPLSEGGREIPWSTEIFCWRRVA
jgi:hypothetical protein